MLSIEKMRLPWRKDSVRQAHFCSFLSIYAGNYKRLWMFRKIASGLFGESQALPRQFCAHFTDTVENPGWFGVALFQVIKCRLAGEDTDRIDSCIDTAGDVCVDAVTDDHGVLFGDAELF